MPLVHRPDPLCLASSPNSQLLWVWDANSSQLHSSLEGPHQQLGLSSPGDTRRSPSSRSYPHRQPWPMTDWHRDMKVLLHQRTARWYHLHSRTPHRQGFSWNHVFSQLLLLHPLLYHRFLWGPLPLQRSCIGMSVLGSISILGSTQDNHWTWKPLNIVSYAGRKWESHVLAWALKKGVSPDHL